MAWNASPKIVYPVEENKGSQVIKSYKECEGACCILETEYFIHVGFKDIDKKGMYQNGFTTWFVY